MASKMEVILRQEVPNLGYPGDVVMVKPGYARNYLIPNNIALIANNSNRRMMEENSKQAAHKIAQQREKANELKAKLEKASVKIAVRAGTSGRIFGSVTTLQIAQSLAAQGIEVDRRKIKVGDIKEVGEYDARIELHRDVVAEVKLNVVDSALEEEPK